MKIDHLIETDVLTAKAQRARRKNIFPLSAERTERKKLDLIFGYFG
jgi:hypothetical protein